MWRQHLELAFHTRDNNRCCWKRQQTSFITRCMHKLKELNNKSLTQVQQMPCRRPQMTSKNILQNKETAARKTCMCATRPLSPLTILALVIFWPLSDPPTTKFWELEECQKRAKKSDDSELGLFIFKAKTCSVCVCWHQWSGLQHADRWKTIWFTQKNRCLIWLHSIWHFDKLNTRMPAVKQLHQVTINI